MVVDGAKDWAALKKWTDSEYITQAVKNTQATNFAHDDVGLVNSVEALDDQLAKINQNKKYGLDGFDFSGGLP